MLYICAQRVMEEITTALRMIQGSLHSITFFFGQSHEKEKASNPLLKDY